MLGMGAGPEQTPARGGPPVDDGGRRADEDAFAAVFDEHLEPVFETAWRVLQERWAAAEITGEAFVEVWRYHTEVPADGWVPALHDAARRRARGWLAVNPGAGPPGAHFEDRGPLPTLGPTLRARIVAALDAQGVPTTGPAAPTPDVPEPATGLTGALGGRLRSGIIVGAAALGVLITGAGIVQLVTGRDGGDGSVETGPPRPDDPPEATPTSARPVTTMVATTTATSSTTSSSTTTTAPSTTTSTSSTTTPPTSAPPATRPATTTTRGTAPPRILRFSGDFYDFNGDDCRSPQEMLTVRWQTEGATSGRIRREGGDWIPLRRLASGELEVCDHFGTEWDLEVSNAGGTDRASFEQDDMTRT